MNLEGIDAVTLFCGESDHSIVTECLDQSGVLHNADLQWSSIDCSCADGYFTVTRLMFAPGSEFSSVILGAHNAISNSSKEAHPGAKKNVLTLLESCDMLLGVRFASTVLNPDCRVAAIQSIASGTRALLFDGFTMMDASGNPLVLLDPA